MKPVSIIARILAVLAALVLAGVILGQPVPLPMAMEPVITFTNPPSFALSNMTFHYDVYESSNMLDWQYCGAMTPRQQQDLRTTPSIDPQKYWKFVRILN